jgi:hypothetical protein
MIGRGVKYQLICEMFIANHQNISNAFAYRRREVHKIISALAWCAHTSLS